MEPAGNPEAFAVVDVETTGTERYRDRIVSVGVVRLDGECRIVDRWASLVNPERPMGATHIHGLTDAMVERAPTFSAIAPELRGRLEGSVLVAHNLPFDWGFLSTSFSRCGMTLGDHEGICTLELTQMLRRDLPDARLDTVAAAFGIPLDREGRHDALEDALVTAQIFTHLYAAARGLNLDPISRLRQDRAPHLQALPRSPYENPGAGRPGEPLIQGMHLAITGDTRTPREELVARASASGLDVTSSVSAKTTLVVANDPASTTAKAQSARQLGAWMVDEATFLRLLEDVRPGTLRKEHRPSGAGERPAVPVTKPPGPPGPLSGEHVLLLGNFADADALAAQIEGAGGVATHRVSKGVTLVVTGADPDPHRLEAAIGYGAIAISAEGLAARLEAGPTAKAAESPGPVQVEVTSDGMVNLTVTRAEPSTLEPSLPPAGWHADPYRRYPWRYWDGRLWTGYVSVDGQTYTDSV